MKDKIHNRDNMKETHHIVPVFYKNTISRGERKSKKPEKLDDAEMEQNHKKTENVDTKLSLNRWMKRIHIVLLTIRLERSTKLSFKNMGNTNLSAEKY